MSKRSIQFAGVLFVLAAILAVSAQESTTALNNASLNNTTLLNNTTFNATTSEPIIAAANESVTEAPVLSTEMVNETASTEIMPALASEAIPAQNETPVAPIEVVAPQNETAPATKATASENATAAVETLPVIPALQSSGMQIGSPQRTTYAIGGTGRTPNLFSINGNSLAQGAYEIGLPAETIMDLSALPFFVNKI
ncbi:MAG: hypothetical protein PHS80_07925 [Methanothrix sp.]|nr:hypothetical protein [Methanothrix sp.]MDD4447338.1 hypothetical protein [Methanothrix sp.]